MRILVIDDYLNVEMALRGILDGHTVTGVRDPVALPRMLAYEEPFEAAIVDLRYVQSAATGLTALATLGRLSPGTKTIISTTDEEENRLLYLLAAFQFFDPKALLAKRADAFVTRAVIEAIGRGDPSPSPDADPFRRAATMRPPLLDQLVHNRTELGIWQELARFDKRLQIASAAHVHPRTLDAFTAAKGAAIDVVAAHFSRPARGPGQVDAGPAARSANLIRVIHFARTHEQFFADHEVAGLLEASWRSRRDLQRSFPCPGAGRPFRLAAHGAAGPIAVSTGYLPVLGAALRHGPWIAGLCAFAVTPGALVVIARGLERRWLVPSEQFAAVTYGDPLLAVAAGLAVWLTGSRTPHGLTGPAAGVVAVAVMLLFGLAQWRDELRRGYYTRAQAVAPTKIWHQLVVYPVLGYWLWTAGIGGLSAPGGAAVWAGKAVLLALVGVWAAANVYDRRHPKLGHPPFDWRLVRPWPRPWAAESQTLLAAETHG